MNSMFPMTRVIDTALNNHRPVRRNEGMSCGRSTQADVLEGDKMFKVIMDLPGIKVESLDISLENQVLNVKAVRETEVPEGFQRVRHERPARTEFQRTFNLGNGIDESGIEAKFENGVLELILPKSEQSLARRIEVK